jgi:hypothetical protein
VHEPDTTDRLTEVARALLEAARGIHAANATRRVRLRQEPPCLCQRRRNAPA